MSAERLNLLWGITMASGPRPGAHEPAGRGAAAGSGLVVVAPGSIGWNRRFGLQPRHRGGPAGELVLFEGGPGLRLPGGELRTAVLRIVAVRLLVAFGGALLAAHWLAGLNWSLAAS